MAFNPFHRFRKHQKVIFAVMAIVCMFVFVLQFGKGDFFDRAASLFGGGKTQGPLVATVYGTKVYEKELVDQSRRQQAASALVAALMVEAVDSALNDAAALKPAKDSDIDKVRTNIQTRRGFQGVDEDLKTVSRLKQEIEGKSGKDQERKVLDELEAALHVQGKIGFSPLGRAVYFGGRQTLEDMLDFRLWQHQADSLGIVLNDDDVRKLLARETGGRDLLPEGSFKSDSNFKKAAANFPGALGNYSESDLLEAARQEYRVILAHEALLGDLPEAYLGRDMTSFFDRKLTDSPYQPVSVSPGDFLTYLRDQRTAVKAAVLPVPVAAFEDQVKDEPKESALRELFDNHRSEEPAPDRPQPGFKQPRRVRIEYVIAPPDSDFYKEAGKARVAMSAAEQILAGARPYAAGGGVGAWAALAARPVAQDTTQNAYGSYLKDMNYYIGKGAFLPAKEGELFGVNAAHLAGALARGNALGVPGALASADAEIRQRHERNVALVAASTIGGGGGINTLGQPGLSLPFRASVQPLSKLEPDLLRQSERVEAQALVVRNLKTVEEELKKRATKPEEARAYIEKAVKEYGLEHKTMTVARDEYELFDDPALAVFKKGAADDKPDEPATAARRRAFARLFLNSAGVYKPVYWSAEGRDSESERAFIDQQLGQFAKNPEFAKLIEQRMDGWLTSWSQSKQPVLFWRAEDDQARERSFKEAREDVLKAWKHQRARVLARQAAKRLGAEAKQRTWPTDAAAREAEVKAWLDEQKLGQAFVLDNVARQVAEPSAVAGKDKTYRPYTVPEKEIPYPPDKFVDQLLRLEQPGEATYVTDRPENTFYVAVLLERTPPSNKEFEDALAHPSADPLWEQCVYTQRKEFREAFLAKMREEAAPKEVENGKWKLPEEVHKRSRREE